VSQKERDFDSEAAAWDEQPGQIEFALELASVIREKVGLTSDMDVLDFGCGTGLLATELLPFVRSVTGADASAGMLKVLDRKITARSLANIRTALIGSDPLPGVYDLILCSLTLHHVEDVRTLLGDFHAMAAPGGLICLCDIDLDGGAFHENHAGVFHHGFERDNLGAIVEAAGFVGVESSTAMQLSRPGRDGSVRDFALFLMTGRKAS